MHGSPPTTQALFILPKLIRACCSAAVHVVDQDLVPLAIPKLVQVNIVLTHNPRLVISKREELALILTSDSLELVIGVLNHIKTQTALDEQRSDDDGHVRKLSAQLLDQRTVSICIAL